MAVIQNAFETKGTHLFFVGSDGVTVRKLTCPTGITGVAGGTKDRIDITCLDETGPFRQFIGGFADTQELSVPFVLYDGDAGHIDLMELQRTGETVDWFVGLSDSDDFPTLASGAVLNPPDNRSGWQFQGYVSNLTFDAAINEVIRGTLTVQPSGFTTFQAAA
jgi:hypothetical protein